MIKGKDILIGAIITGMVLLFFSLVLITIWGIIRPSGIPITGSGGRVAIVDIKGIIDDSESVIELLKKYEKDSSIKAIVLRVDSPGGGVAPSQEIYGQLLKLKEKGIPLIVSMSSVAASGGYYISCAADTIVANPGTLTGSIGVLMEFLTIQGLMQKIGVNLEVVKAGELKDVGNFSRQMTEKERAMLQTAITDVHNQFIEAVSESRNIDIEQVEELADGSIFTGNQALELGLVDKLGGLEDAVSIAGRMAGLGDNPKTTRAYPRRQRLIDYLTEKAMSLFGIDGIIKPWPEIKYLYR